ncbi:unnamed protein product [Ectocarpus sp. 4 AP-2014]
MASCYGSISAPSVGAPRGLRYLPIRTKLPDGTQVEVDHFRTSEHAAGHRLLNGVIEEASDERCSGLSWPFEEAMDMDAFRAYFLSHAAFVVRAVPSSPPAETSPTAADVPSSGDGARVCTAGDSSRDTVGREGWGGDGAACREDGAPCSPGGVAGEATGPTGRSEVRSSEGLMSPPGELACSCSPERSVRSSGAATGCSPEDRAVAAAATTAVAVAATIGSDETRKAGSTAVEEEEDERDAGVKVWGAFYIKPNFPGRCSHVCNGGFITDPRRRQRGVAKLMGHAFLRFAKDLGYRASYFNLVFRSNEASLRLWRGLGFTELAVVPKAARLKGIDGLVDAIQFHYDLDNLRHEDLPQDLRESP